jgi:type VI secretion system secreted protein VgrG
MAFLYELYADALPGTFRAFRVEGEEAINRLYEISVAFALEREIGLATLDHVTGTGAKLAICERDGAPPRITYHGVVAALELVDELEHRTVARLRLVPRAWQLALGEHSRVFVGQSLREILKQTLQDGGLASEDYDLRLFGEYPPLPYVCQYRESRLAFVTRWLERVGAYYCFEQGESREKLVITDDPSAQRSALGWPVRFVPHSTTDESIGEALRTLRVRTQAVPARVKVRDYSFANPRLAVIGEAAVARGPGGEVALFGVNVATPAEAKAHAATWAQRYLSERTTYRASGRVAGLAPGLTFTLAEHPHPALNRGYLVTRVRHEGVDTGRAPDSPGALPSEPVYRCEIEAVRAGERYVPPAVTGWPRIAGSVRAHVDGPQDSEYAQIDDDGCYLVRLMFDESGLPDGGASARVRMLQPHAGNPEGMHFPLRKGTEVQIVFLKGDPDQPVIAGAVPNPLTPSPVTRANRSQNVLQTGGVNRLEIEDAKGSEYIDLSSPTEKSFLHLGAHAGLGTHNYVLSTEGDYAMHTGGNRDITVGGRQNENVKGDVTETYHGNQTTTVDGALKETIDGGATQTIHGGSKQTIDGGMTQTISGGETRVVTGGQHETLDGPRTQTITGSSVETIHGSLTQTIAGGATITTPASHTVIAGGGFELSTPSTVTMVAHGGFKLFTPGRQTRLDEEAANIGGQLFSFAHAQSTFCALKIDLRPIYLNVGAVQANLFVLKASTGVKQTTTTAICLSEKGVHATTHILSKHTGVQLWGG